MNFKQIAAEKAVSFIKNNTSVGFGAGTTMRYVIEFLAAAKLTGLKLYTSSADTKNILINHGFTVQDISDAYSLDIYFDGCDQFDKDLNALKSGAGIHTTEKLFASMAKQFILAGDESKYVETLNTKFPVVIEVLPHAVPFAEYTVKQKFSVAKTELRKTPAAQPLTTQYGNYLIDIWFNKLPVISTINPLLKEICGILETSLFHNLATHAVITGENGVKILSK